MEMTFTPFYLLTFCVFSCFIAPYNRAKGKGRDVISIICLSILIILFGLRGSVGDDYSYYQAFYKQPTYDNALIYGPGYTLLNWIFRTVHMPFHALLFFISILTNCLLMNFWKSTKNNIPFVIAIFFALGGIINEVDFIRNCLGLALFVNSIKYIQEKRNAKKFFLFNTIGCLFHYSSIIYLPFFWIGTKRIKQRIYGAILVVGLFLGSLQLPILNGIEILSHLSYLDHLYEYIDLYSGITVPLSLTTIEMIVTGASIYVFYSKLTKTPLGQISVLAFLCFFLSYSVFSYYGVLATRLGNLFIFSYWVVWPLIISHIQKKIVKITAYILIFLYLTLRLLSISLLPQWQYEFFF